MNGDIMGLTSDVVAAFVRNNSIQKAEIPALIHAVHQALATAASGPAEEPVVELKPAVPVRKSVTPDHIICLEDGKKFKSLKRHLRTRYDLSPDEYRAKWGLPSDYPMVAPNYAAARSELAKKIGLGRKAAQAVGKAGGRRRSAA